MGIGDEHPGEGTEASSLGNGHLTDGHRSRNIWSPAATATTAGSYGGLSSLWPLLGNSKNIVIFELQFKK